MRKTDKKSGFTLVEIMIVVAIIGLLAAIAVPSFMSARQNSQTNACINNLRQIDGAKSQWALENGAVTGNSGCSIGGLVGTYLKASPDCPVGGVNGYNVNAIGTIPNCTSFNSANHNAVLPNS